MSCMRHENLGTMVGGLALRELASDEPAVSRFNEGAMAAPQLRIGGRLIAEGMCRCHHEGSEIEA